MHKPNQYLFVGLLSVLTASLSAQSVQRGVVLEYQGNEPKSALAGVSISAKDAASTMSNGDGTFTLQFRTLHAGSDIQMRRIEKAGYEVMNQEVVEQFRVGRDESKTLQVVMCSKAKLQQLRDGYRSVASRRYQQQLQLSEAEAERLRQQGRLKAEEYNARLDSLEADYDDKLSRLETYIDKFARIDLTDVDACEQQIVALVQEGKFDEAIALYDQQDFPAKLRQSRDDRQQLDGMKSAIATAEAAQLAENMRLRQSIDRQVTLLCMAGGTENILKAHELLHRTFLADTTYSDARREYALSLRTLGQYDEMLSVLQNGLKVERDAFARGMIVLELMDVSYGPLADFSQALRYADMADSLMSPLTENNYQVLTRGLPAWTTIQLSYYTQIDVDAGKAKAYAERARAAWSPDERNSRSLASYAALVNVLSDYYARVGNHGQMLWCATEGVRLGSQAMALNPGYREMGDAYVSAASTYALEADEANLQQSARAACQSFATLVGKLNTKSVLEATASSYYSLLYALVSANEYALADSVLQDPSAQKCLDQAAQSNLGTYRLYAALIRLLDVRILLEKGRVDAAEAEARQTLTEMEQLEEAAGLLIAFRPEMLSRIALARHDGKEAVRQAQQYAVLCSVNYEEGADAWTADELCRARLLVAEAQLSAGAKGKARKAVQQAEKVAVFPCNKRDIERIKNLLK